MDAAEEYGGFLIFIKNLIEKNVLVVVEGKKDKIRQMNEPTYLSRNLMSLTDAIYFFLSAICLTTSSSFFWFFLTMV